MKLSKKEYQTECTMCLTHCGNFFCIAPHMQAIPQHQMFSMSKKTSCQSFGLMSEEGERCFCRQLLLRFPRETVVEAASEKEWEGCGLAQMGHSIRCLYISGYLDFLSDTGLWRILKCLNSDKQQILIFIYEFLRKTFFLGIHFSHNLSKPKYIALSRAQYIFLFYTVHISQSQVGKNKISHWGLCTYSMAKIVQKKIIK